MLIELPSEVPESAELLRGIAEGDEAAFERLLLPWRAPLFAFLYRLIAQREDAEDLTQDVMLEAIEVVRRSSPPSPLRIWLLGLAARMALEHLESQRPWRPDAHLIADTDDNADPDALSGIAEAIDAPGFRFDMYAHVAFCFTAVGRSIPPLDQASLLLREVFGLTEEETAAVLQESPARISEHVRSARAAMTATFQPLCRLINPQGRCDQCRTIRIGLPQGRRGRELIEIEVEPGTEPTPENLLSARLRLVRGADLERGPSHRFHGLLFEGLTNQENPHW